ncbi:antibiotic biosynthesis monooxygenase [Neptuniibacter pectenicola]|uniref:antibiotic biosynthesis monooxygenase n=1 Tax=Neptuniibacter pectenicola TaxID=1806669 RepID=UPI00082AA54D|nr:antibiotic biosynthesis monooxygenase [Neptuniibacter pectenicola]
MSSAKNTKPTVCQPGDEGPITVSISRKVKLGSEAEYENWVSGVINAASSYPGHLGTNVLRPSQATNHEYVIIYRFDNYANCQHWEQSETRSEWLAKLESLVEGEAVTKRGTGLEFWFDLPELPTQKHPSPHKMALILIIVVYVLVVAINLAFAPILEPMSFWFKTLTIVVAQVLLMTYVVMPRVTRLLKSWLYS